MKPSRLENNHVDSVVKVPIVDLHCDTVMDLQAGDELGSRPEGHLDIPRLKEGGVGLQVFACFISSMIPDGHAFAQAQALLDEIDRACLAHPEELFPVESVAGVHDAWRTGRVAILRAIENGHAIENDLSNVEKFYRRGVRAMTLTHTRHLAWAGSSAEQGGEGRGLTSFGEKVLAAMNECGMIVDVSHASVATFRDVARLARKPFIASHSCARALCPIARNLNDDQIRAIADSGGVVGINFFPGFLDFAYQKRCEETSGDLFNMVDRIELKYWDDPVKKKMISCEGARELRKRLAGTIVERERIIDHIEHIVALAGDECVGFGSDFDGVPDLPVGVADCAAFPAILEDLRRRGFSEESVEKIAWRNFFRVFAQAS